mgnify:CR=1 FL=1
MSRARPAPAPGWRAGWRRRCASPGTAGRPATARGPGPAAGTGAGGVPGRSASRVAGSCRRVRWERACRISRRLEAVAAAARRPLRTRVRAGRATAVAICPGSGVNAEDLGSHASPGDAQRPRSPDRAVVTGSASPVPGRDRLRQPGSCPPRPARRLDLARVADDVALAPAYTGQPGEQAGVRSPSSGAEHRDQIARGRLPRGSSPFRSEAA